MAYVMVVDDDEDFADAVAILLRHTGHEVRIELDTRSAVKSMEKRPPDLLVLDIMFPESSSAGFELARAMRHCHTKLKDIPILILTAINMRFPLTFSAEDIDPWLPVADFQEKPVDFDMLRAKVTKLLQKAKPNLAVGEPRRPNLSGSG